MNKFFLNVVAFVLAAVLSLGLLWINKDIIIKHYYTSLLLLKLPSQTNMARLTIENLETGIIHMFGSSELAFSGYNFIAYNYFTKKLNLPMTYNGYAGYQSFAITAQLAALENKKVRQNARVIVFLSPGWFINDHNANYSEGTEVNKFLECMNTSMMYQLYFRSDVDNYFKKLVGQYIKKNMAKIKNPSYIYKYATNYPNISKLDQFFIKNIVETVSSEHSINKRVSYKAPKLNYQKLKEKAKNVETPSDNNEFGINNEYYSKHIEQYVKNGMLFDNFTFNTPGIEKNQEYKDFLNLVKLLKTYKIKPLFIMQDVHPYIYVKNRKSLHPILASIKKEILSNGFGYLDMWTYDKSKYQKGKLTDIVHTGELGWVEIDKKIIEHFMTGDVHDK